MLIILTNIANDINILFNHNNPVELAQFTFHVNNVKDYLQSGSN